MKNPAPLHISLDPRIVAGGGKTFFEALLAAHPSPANIFRDPPIRRKHALFVDSGRSALFVGLSALRRARSCGGRIFLPAICCRSVVDVASVAGFEPIYYGLGADLQTVKLPIPPRREDVFLYIHYFGFRNRAVEEALTRLPKEERPAVVEDCAQVALGATRSEDATGHFGDVVIASLRKFLPVPDGGLACADFPLDAHLEEPDEGFVSRRVAALADRVRPGTPRDPQGAEARLDAWRAPRALSWMGRHVLERIDLRAAAATRLRAYRDLAAACKEEGISDRAEMPFEERFCEEKRIVRDAAPLGLPVLLRRSRRGEVLRRLRRDGMPSPLEWSPNPHAPFAEDAALLRRLVLLPLPEDEPEARRVVATLREATG